MWTTSYIVSGKDTQWLVPFPGGTVGHNEIFEIKFFPTKLFHRAPLFGTLCGRVW